MSYTCFVCNKPVPDARVEFLLSNGVTKDNITCIAHSQTQKVKGIYSGEHGTSSIILCKRVYNDSVRSKFGAEEHEEEEEDESSSPTEIDD